MRNTRYVRPSTRPGCGTVSVSCRRLENTGTEDVVYLEMFRAARYEDVSLNNWIAALPPELVKQHLGLSDATLAAMPKNNVATVSRGKG